MTNKVFLILSLLLSQYKFSFCQEYDSFFTPNRIRVNYSISGLSGKEIISDVRIVKEQVWGGSRNHLIDNFEYGAFLVKVFDLGSNKPIYSKGYSNLFSEWQTTIDAQSKTRRYNDCLILPEPKKKVYLKFYKRDSLLVFKEIFSINIDPKEVPIASLNSIHREVKNIHQPTDYKKALDIVFVSEGYTDQQKSKFFNDVERFKDYLFLWEPYNTFRNTINITAVFTPSINEGTDKPEDSVWVNTALNSSLSTFGIKRYLTIPDITQAYDLLNGLAVDRLCILVNSDVYAGGGIYNNSTVFTADHLSASFLFIHEFGHCFAGLADEYSTTKPEYTNKVNLSIEPIEPNITTLVDLKCKWGNLINDSIPIPTPDSVIYKNCIGAFEGAAYQHTGIYRSEIDCAMRSTSCTSFCKVCQQSIAEFLEIYTQ